MTYQYHPHMTYQYHPHMTYHPAYFTLSGYMINSQPSLIRVVVSKLVSSKRLANRKGSTQPDEQTQVLFNNSSILQYKSFHSSV